MRHLLFVITLLLSGIVSNAQVAQVGRPLTSWKEGFLDLHHINTGMGNAAYYIFPDGTTMLVDAGEMGPDDKRAGTPRNATNHPDNSKKPYEWIAHYIKSVAPDKKNVKLDYALITHFHDDHFGSWYPKAPLSKDKKYALSGITGVGDLIPIGLLLDRGYPSYNYPTDITTALRRTKDSSYRKTFENYKAFVNTGAEKGMRAEMFRAGSKSQVRLRNPQQFNDFYVQNIKSNGKIWTGKDSSTNEHFIEYKSDDRKTWPDENSLSNALTINYGAFVYYTGGDNPGNVFYGDSKFRDVETPMAKVVGEVDVATLDHHGNRDAVNEFQVKTFKPRVWIGQTWSADHPGHEVLVRMTTPYLYNGSRDLFSTNMLESNRNVIGPLIDNAYKSQHGHVVVRVMPGGKEYYMIILDDTRRDMPVKNIFGPYVSKKAGVPKLIGHRGGVVDSTYTENGMAALEAAYKRGYYMAEVDVRLSKDNQLIMHHNNDFRTYYNVDRKVSDMNWEEMRGLKSDKDGTSPVLFEEALKYCQGRLQIMLDNKITGNDTVSFRRIEELMKKYDLLDSALIIGTTETRNYFAGKARAGYPLKMLKQFKEENKLNPAAHYLFDHGNVLIESDVKWAQENNIIVVPSINKFHYRDIYYMDGAKRDITNLKKWNVKYYQIDSEFDQWLR